MEVNVTPLMQYGALGLVAIFMVIFLKFAADYINKNNRFIQDLSLRSMTSHEETSKEFSTSQLAVAGSLQTLGREVTETQGKMRDSLEEMQGALISFDEERQEEHMQLMADHQDIMGSLKRIEGKLDAET